MSGEKEWQARPEEVRLGVVAIPMPDTAVCQNCGSGLRLMAPEPGTDLIWLHIKGRCVGCTVGIARNIRNLGGWDSAMAVLDQTLANADGQIEDDDPPNI